MAVRRAVIPSRFSHVPLLQEDRELLSHAFHGLKLLRVRQRRLAGSGTRDLIHRVFQKGRHGTVIFGRG